jgi:hypothetical protein
MALTPGKSNIAVRAFSKPALGAFSLGGVEMRSIADKRMVSVGLVLCMVIASIAVLFSAIPARGAAYQSPVTYVDGNETMQNLGRSVALMDLNGDGIADLVAGAPYTTANGLKDAGSVTVCLSDSGVAMSKIVVINGTHEEDLFGWTVANIGDVNGDGREDLAVGAPLSDPPGAVDAGNISIFYSGPGFDGTPDATINSANPGEELGFSLGTAGDVNGDNIDDILAGAPFYGSGAGRAYIFYGGNPPNAVPDKTFTGTVAGAHLGWSVSGGVSVDGNANLDMIAGAPGQGNSGAAYIIRDLSRANPTVTIVNARSADENFSFSVSLIPDLNNDTIGDIAIGAPTNNDNGTHAGAVYILYGGAKFNTVADMTLQGWPDEWFGWSVAAGDFHEDGISDLLVGAPNSHLNASSVGRAYAYFGGSVPASSPSLTLVPDAGASFFGASLAVGGNLTRDLAPDFAVGDPLFNVPGTPNAGRVYVYAGEHITIPTNPIVKGYVYVPNSTQGMQGFTITLESATFNKSTTTNAAGYFQMTAVPGTFWLNASKAGYITNSSTVSLALNDDKTVQPFYPLKVPMVAGTVADNVTGLMIQGATVALYNGTTLVDEMVTGTNGTFWFWLPDDLVPPEGGSTDMTIMVWDATHYGSTSDFSLARNQTLPLSFLLDRFQVVGGSVRESLFLSAVRGALVQANQGSTIIATTTTGIRGNYQMVATNATPGKLLYVNVTAAGYFRTNASVLAQKNSTPTLNFILQPDNTPPTSQLVALPQYSTAAVFTITATASDTNGIQEVQLWYRKGVSGGYTMYGKDTTSPYAFDFNSTTTGGDGLYSFYSIAVDYASNVEAPPAGNDTWTIVDAHAPTLSVLAPTAGQFVANSSVQITWTGSDAGSGIQKFDVDLDSAGWIDMGLALTHTYTSVTDGPHSVSVRATDNASLVTTITVDFIVDTVFPMSQVNALPPYTALEDFLMTATASDSNGIQEVQLWFRYGGSGGFSYFGSDTTSPYVFEFNSSNFSGDGLYEFYSRAIDDAGNNETPPSTNDTRTIVDTAVPTVSITAPLMNQTLGNATVQVNWSGSDAASGIASYRIRMDGGVWANQGLSVQCAFSSVADGNHTVDVNATDNAGHSALASVNFTVDSAAPTVSITTPVSGSAISSNAIGVHWTASDNGTGIETLEVSKDGVNWLSVDVNSSDYTFTTVGVLAEGHYTVSVRATDFGGLTATASADIIIDRTPPTVSISSPTADKNIKASNLTVRWAMSDMGSGVSIVQISVDHGAFRSIGTNRTWELTDLAKGEHNVTIRVSDAAGNHRDVSVSFTVSAAGGISTMMGAGIAVVLIMVVIATVLLMRRKKPAAMEPPKKHGKA